MAERKTFEDMVDNIIAQDSTYSPEAYVFLMEALRFTQKKIKRTGHLSGAELLEGIREFGLEQFGPMTREVFSHWGVNSTEDFGKIVFNMVENKLLARTPTDSIEDFRNVYDFKEVFDKC
jgi:uncharacterized repeat protein (TIGR04138 family)